jgi:hypothetical protein
MYEGVSKSFRTGRLERELQMVQLTATTFSCIDILWVSLVSFAATTLCVTSQRVFVVVSVYFVIDSVRKLLEHPRTSVMWSAGSVSNNKIVYGSWTAFRHYIAAEPVTYFHFLLVYQSNSSDEPIQQLIIVNGSLSAHSSSRHWATTAAHDTGATGHVILLHTNQHASRLPGSTYHSCIIAPLVVFQLKQVLQIALTFIALYRIFFNCSRSSILYSLRAHYSNHCTTASCPRPVHIIINWSKYDKVKR